MTEKQNTTVSAITAKVSEIRDRAARDNLFRRDLLADPTATVASFIGVDIPSDVTIRFIENEGATLTIVLPDVDSDELSDEELEAAAGGRSVSTTFDQHIYIKRGGGLNDTKEPPLQDNIDKTLI